MLTSVTTPELIPANLRLNIRHMHRHKKPTVRNTQYTPNPSTILSLPAGIPTLRTLLLRRLRGLRQLIIQLLLVSDLIGSRQSIGIE